MKKYSIPFVILSFLACSTPQKQEAVEHIPQEEATTEKEAVEDIPKEEVITKQENNLIETEHTNEISFRTVNERAVLIGENIELFDNRLTPTDTLSSITGEIVDVIAVSDSIFNKTKNFCDAFWFVKISIDGKEGVVNGRQVFKINESDYEVFPTGEGYYIKIFRTEFFGMGVEYKGDFLGCPVDQPVVLKDIKNNYHGLVNLVPNDYSKNASWDNEYPFFEIRNDYGSHDEIDSVITEGTRIKLKIHRSFQEGENEYTVLLKLDSGSYLAEYLNYGEIKYESQ